MIGYRTGLGLPPGTAVGPRIAAALERMDSVTASSDVVGGGSANTRPWGCPDPGWNTDPTERLCVSLNDYQNVLAETINNLASPIGETWLQLKALRASTAAYAEQKRIAESAWNKLVTKFEALADWVYRARTTFMGRDRLTKWRHEPRTAITLLEDSLFDQLVVQHFVSKWSGVENQRVTWGPGSVFGVGPKQGETVVSLTPAEREQIENYMRLADIGALMDEINRQFQIAKVVDIERGMKPTSPEKKLPSDDSPWNATTTTTTALLGLAAVAGFAWWFWNRRGVKSPLTP